MTVTSSKAAVHRDMSERMPAAEFKPCLWKLIAVTAGILAAAFVAMETVDDTYMGSFETTTSTPPVAAAG